MARNFDTIDEDSAAEAVSVGASAPSVACGWADDQFRESVFSGLPPKPRRAVGVEDAPQRSNHRAQRATVLQTWGPWAARCERSRAEVGAVKH